MEALFLKLLNMSINASWLVLAVLLLRLIFKKAPKYIRCILWGLVAIRLICPFSFESVLSLIPSAETVPTDIIYSSEPNIHSGISFLNSTVNPIIENSLAPNPADSANPMQIIAFIASALWISGVVAMLIYAVISFLRVRRYIKEAVWIKENIYICDRIATPFIFGVIKPKIYLPSSISEQDSEFVIAHERAHIERYDHIWKPLGFLLLTAYWFNPVLWLAYILLCRDIELACDERVIKSLGADIKKPYSEALINCSMPRKAISACPLAFGETGVKGRIKAVLNYKKPAFWVIVLAVVACVVTAICFLTDPKDKWESENYGIVATVSAAECDDVKFSFIRGSVNKYNPYIEVKWENNTKEQLCYGEDFKLYYGNKELVRDEGYAWNTLLYGINSGGVSTETCSLMGYDITKSGSYRLEKEFHFDSNSDKKYVAYIDFTIDRRFSFIGLQYKGEKIVFEDGMYSSIIYTDKSIPQYLISEEMHLFTNENLENPSSSSWYDIGELQSFKLESETFDEILNNVMWDSGYSAKFLRKNNKNAFRVIDKKNNRLYYLLEQDNGEVYIAYGYTEGYGIRWIFKMGLVSNVGVPVTNSVGIYVYNGSPEPISAPSLRLDYSDRTFHFSWSLFSSYMAMGDFEYDGSSVICTTDDGKNVYRFNAVDNGFVFDGKHSSAIPSYRYSGDAKESECPVPDGALFEFIVEDSTTIMGKGEGGMNVNPFFVATVLEVYDSSVLVEPDEGEDERSSSDKITVSTDVISTNPVPELKIREKIRIVYNGEIAESYPASINKVFAIYKAD